MAWIVTRCATDWRLATSSAYVNIVQVVPAHHIELVPYLTILRSHSTKGRRLYTRIGLIQTVSTILIMIKVDLILTVLAVKWTRFHAVHLGVWYDRVHAVRGLFVRHFRNWVSDVVFAWLVLAVALVDYSLVVILSILCAIWHSWIIFRPFPQLNRRRLRRIVLGLPILLIKQAFPTIRRNPKYNIFILLQKRTLLDLLSLPNTANTSTQHGTIVYITHLHGSSILAYWIRHWAVCYTVSIL